MVGVVPGYFVDVERASVSADVEGLLHRRLLPAAQGNEQTGKTSEKSLQVGKASHLLSITSCDVSQAQT